MNMKRCACAQPQLLLLLATLLAIEANDKLHPTTKQQQQSPPHAPAHLNQATQANAKPIVGAITLRKLTSRKFFLLDFAC